jgi:hypothetical protein
MPIIADAYTDVKAEKSVNEIIEMLRSHHASDIIINYKEGTPIGLAFIIERSNGSALSFQLPASIDKVYAILIEKRRASWRADVVKSTRMQAERVAWRIIRDWIRAQMAIIDTELVTTEQVFFPYLQINGKGLYNMFEESGYKLLSGGNKNATV